MTHRRRPKKSKVEDIQTPESQTGEQSSAQEDNSLAPGDVSENQSRNGGSDNSGDAMMLDMAKQVQ